MARAKRHYLPGHIWHITHRCHKREFLLKFARDRMRWLQWLYEAKSRYGLTILDYMVTSNHIHLLVLDDGDRETIPKSIRLIAGRIGQEYNQRKNRRGAYWEDRYHATAVEEGAHFIHCLTYIDLNMVRAGVVDHPSMWPFSGYNEIQNPKRKNVLIDYEKLLDLLGIESFSHLQKVHQDWVEDSMVKGNLLPDDQWTKSIAVGSIEFTTGVKTDLGVLAKGRKLQETDYGYQLREVSFPYEDQIGRKKEEIGIKNTYLW